MPLHPFKIRHKLIKATFYPSSDIMSFCRRPMKADINEYRMLLPEYRRNPLALINRLWEDTRLQILSSPGVRKIYRPSDLGEFWVRSPLDPQQRKIDRVNTLQGPTFDPGSLIPERMVPVGPAFD